MIVHVLGVPMDLGSGRRGVDMGPSAIRIAGVETALRELGHTVVDEGDIPIKNMEELKVGDVHARYLAEIARASAVASKKVERIVRKGHFPLVLGGDHSIALGTLGGLARARGPGGVLWIDAHADMNTSETTPSGNVHGMALAAALGIAGPEFSREAWPLPAVEPGRAALIGTRSLDQGERDLLGRLDAKVFTMTDLDRMGVETVMNAAIEHVQDGTPTHVSFDMDVVDPEVAPGVGTPVRGGLSYREAHLALELIAESGLVDSLEVVEVNPVLDRENETGKLAVELVASALGARIL